MATVLARPSSAEKLVIGLPGRRYDHFFFSGMALLIMLTVFVGFAHTYYLAGIFHAPLPSAIIHIHGAAFSCWILLLVTQTSLVSAGRVDIHRRLGIAGFLLACLMVILGVLASTDSLVREAGPPGRDPKFFYIIPLTDMLVFATLVFFAFRARSNPPAHPGGLRPVVHAQGLSRYALRGRFPHLRATDKDPHRQNGRVARLRQLGPIPSPLSSIILRKSTSERRRFAPNSLRA